MATLRELLGDKYKEGMSLAEAETTLSGMNLANLSTGGYVKKEKYDADTKLLNEYKTQLDGKQGEIDSAVAKAIEKAKSEAKAEYEKQLANERTADKRKRAKEKAYEGLTDEQKGIYDALLKDEDLTLSEDGEAFANFDELTKPIKEKYKTLFPIDDGSHGKAGLDPVGGKSQTSKTADFDIEAYKKLR